MKILLLGLGLFIAIQSLSFAATKPRPQVFVQKAQTSKVSTSLLFPGMVKSRVEANIRADEDLISLRSFVSLGQKVKRGDKLLELRNQDTSLNYNNKTLRAPVDGVVAAIFVDQGQYVTKGQELIMLNNPSDLYIKVEVPVANYRDVAPGLKARGNFNAGEKKKFEAQVLGVGSVVDPRTGTVPVELKPTSSAESLLPGSIVSVEVMLNEQEKLLVPESSIYYSGDKTFMPVLKDGKVHKVEISLGIHHQGKVEITKGVAIGEELIVGAGEFLKDGMAVDVAKNM